MGLNHIPSGRFAANAAWLAVQVMAHNLARWTARIGLGEQIVTTKTLRRRFFSLAGRLTPLGAPAHFASSQALALGNPVQPRPGTAASDSTSCLTARRCLSHPTDNRRSPPTRATPVRERLLPRPLSSSCPPAPIADRHWRPQKRLQTARQPPVYPNSSPDHRACNSLTPFRCPRAVHRWIRAKTNPCKAERLRQPPTLPLLPNATLHQEPRLLRSLNPSPLMALNMSHFDVPSPSHRSAWRWATVLGAGWVSATPVAPDKSRATWSCCWPE